MTDINGHTLKSEHVLLLAGIMIFLLVIPLGLVLLFKQDVENKRIEACMEIQNDQIKSDCINGDEQ